MIRIRVWQRYHTAVEAVEVSCELWCRRVGVSEGTTMSYNEQCYEQLMPAGAGRAADRAAWGDSMFVVLVSQDSRD